MQKESCSSNFQSAWKVTYEKGCKQVASRIEKESLTPEFSSLDPNALADVIACVVDEPFPDAYAICSNGPDGKCVGTASNGFSLAVSANGDKASAYVSIVSNNIQSIQLNPRHETYGLFRVELTAEANKCTKRPLLACGEYDHVSSSWNWASLFSSCNMRDYMHVGHPATLTMGFKAAMLKLHRQCYALINYAAARSPEDGGRSGNKHSCISTI